MSKILICVLCLGKMIWQFTLCLIPLTLILAIITKLTNKKNWLSELLVKVVR